jgi:hypothetical protein
MEKEPNEEQIIRRIIIKNNEKIKKLETENKSLEYLFQKFNINAKNSDNENKIALFNEKKDEHDQEVLKRYKNILEDKPNNVMGMDVMYTEEISNANSHSGKDKKIASKQAVTYSEKNFELLLENLQKRYTSKKLCEMAGYGPYNISQNFNNMISASPNIKEKRWNKLVAALEKENLQIQEFLQVDDTGFTSSEEESRPSHHQIDNDDDGFFTDWNALCPRSSQQKKEDQEIYDFGKRNYPKSNTFKGEYSSSDSDS